MPKDIPLEERFMSFVDKTESCWIWKGAVNSYGYGSFGVDGKVMNSHRVSYQLFKGTIDNGLFVRHLCRTKGCVNPEHLTLGTHLQNMEDKKRDGTVAKGEKIGNSKLTENFVKNLLEEYKSWVGLKFHFAEKKASDARVSPQTIVDILNNKSWKHIIRN